MKVVMTIQNYGQHWSLTNSQSHVNVHPRPATRSRTGRASRCVLREARPRSMSTISGRPFDNAPAKSMFLSTANVLHEVTSSTIEDVPLVTVLNVAADTLIDLTPEVARVFASLLRLHADHADAMATGGALS